MTDDKKNKPARRAAAAAISLQLEKPLKKKLVATAKKDERSISHVVRAALRMYFEQRRKAAA